MKSEKWVQCTEELAENPERVKAWRNKQGARLRFIAYDKGDVCPIIVRDVDGVLDEYPLQSVECPIYSVECLIEVPIQEEYLTYHNGNGGIKQSYPELVKAQIYRGVNCTHIVKLTYDGKDFKAECVWTKEST